MAFVPTRRAASSTDAVPIAFTSSVSCGSCTLIGTSTNVVVSGLVAGKRGEPLGMFDITWLGVPLFLAGIVYLVVALTGGGPRASATITRFPAAYGVINQFVFGLGSRYRNHYSG